LSDSRPPSVVSQKSAGFAPDGDVISWIRERWVLIGIVVVFLLLIWWFRSGEPRSANGRYVLVKDDVPCESASEPEARRWCYVVLDTRTGRLEERARRIGSRSRH